MRWFDKRTCSFCNSICYHEAGYYFGEQWWNFHSYIAKSGLIVGHGCPQCSQSIYRDTIPKFTFREPYIIQAPHLPKLTIEEVIQIREYK